MSARTGQKGVSRGVVARPAARYRPGRLPEGANLAAEAALLGDSDEEEGVQNEHRHEHDDGDGGTQESLTSFGVAGPSRLLLQQRKTAHIRVDLGSVQIGKKVEPQYDSDEYETDTDEEPAPPKPTFRKPGAGGPPAASTIKKEESSEYETDSEEEDSEEEDEQPAPLLKPVFVPKRLRGTTGAVQAVKEKEDVAAAEYKALKAAQKRKQESHLLAAETIKRELAEKEHEENVPDLSDTDGKDPEAEFQAWRLRELQRIKRTKEAEAEREREQEEMERRRAMPEEERLAEDLKRAKESRDAKPKGQQRFMQKYYHKGAFFQDLDILKKHDFTEATEGSVDVSKLPSMMQVRDYGKRSRSKWTHLANEDTSKPQQDARFKGLSEEMTGGSTRSRGAGGASSGPKGQQQACFICGGPHLKRDCPQAGGQQRPEERQSADRYRDRDRDGGRGGEGQHASGSNRGVLSSSSSSYSASGSRWQSQGSSHRG